MIKQHLYLIFKLHQLLINLIIEMLYGVLILSVRRYFVLLACLILFYFGMFVRIELFRDVSWRIRRHRLLLVLISIMLFLGIREIFVVVILGDLLRSYLGMLRWRFRFRMCLLIRRRLLFVGEVVMFVNLSWVRKR